MQAALAQSSMTLWRAKRRKGAIFRRKMCGFEVFLGLREYEVRRNPCLMPICRATHNKMKPADFLKDVRRLLPIVKHSTASGQGVRIVNAAKALWLTAHGNKINKENCENERFCDHYGK
ncbi:hypothetical protein HNP82_000714 [Catenibacillus scindens]|uniref:Uncharacterized protein n=1 Tax=Catenibacillus scindens TaxID=673271 RepID=A0A7W8H840_9FIRM|nr:hypothetical protein [Catenibacillus scindens]